MRVFTDGEECTSETTTIGDEAVVGEPNSLHSNLASIKSIVAIGSARGGVGKSAITANVAAALARAARKTGIVDADLNSPSILPMLGMKALRRPPATEWIDPGAGPLGLRIASVDLLPDTQSVPFSLFEFEGEAPPVLPNGRAPAQVGYTSSLQRLLGHTRLGALDVLLVDLPPGIEALARFARMVPRAGLLLLSHPSDLAARAATTMLRYAAANAIPVIGIVENMSGFYCGSCHAVRPLMPQGSVTAVAVEAGVPLIERLPFDPRMAETTDRGTLFIKEYPDTPMAKQLIAIAHTIDSAARVATPAPAPERSL
jgi:ATP-binding protein involved in chromosome partitioning